MNEVEVRGALYGLLLAEVCSDISLWGVPGLELGRLATQAREVVGSQ